MNVKQIKKFWELIPETQGCLEGCGECCGPAPMSQKESFIIKEYVKEHALDIPDAPVNGKCPALCQETKKCRIYEVRPITCRIHGLLKVLTCTHIPNPDETRLTPEFIAMLAKWHAYIKSAKYMAIMGFTQEEFDAHRFAGTREMWNKARAAGLTIEAEKKDE